MFFFINIALKNLIDLQRKKNKQRNKYQTNSNNAIDKIYKQSSIDFFKCR